MGTRDYICEVCGNMNTLSPTVVARYPTWVPKRCMDCRDDGQRGPQTASQASLTRSEVLQRFTAGPQTGVFTDGACEPNPGQGGWGAVKVINGQVIEERHGQEQQTTNNRMELQALIDGYKMLNKNEELPVYSDSELCVNTINKWAAAWKRNGWTRGKKREEIKNLDLVQELYALAQSHPRAGLQWIRGHAGSRWNEYADALSRADQPRVI